MSAKPATLHSLIRTSPKGVKFVGTCSLCGTPNLTIADMNRECENIRGLTQDEALVEAIAGSAAVNRKGYAS